MAVRLPLITADGSVSVPSDERACPGRSYVSLPVRRVFGAVRGLGGRSLVRAWAR